MNKLALAFAAVLLAAAGPPQVVPPQTSVGNASGQARDAAAAIAQEQAALAAAAAAQSTANANAQKLSDEIGRATTAEGLRTLNNAAAITGGTVGGLSSLTATATAPPTALIDLQTMPPANGLFSAGAGTYLQFCSVAGCLPGPHLLTQSLVQATTRLDASAQEAALSINLSSATGKAEPWSASTPYALGVQVHGPGENGIYQVTTAGTSSTTGPSGTGTGILDGSVVWAYIGNVLNDGKSALSTAFLMQPGSGHAWSLVSDLVVQPGVGNVNAFGYENDCSNYNKDSVSGSPFLMACLFQGGQGAGTFPMMAYRYVAAGNTNSFGAHYGDFYNGSTTIKDATWYDATNSATSIKVSGNHTFGIDLSSGSYGTAITLPASGFIGFTGQSHALGYNGSTSKLTYGVNTATNLFSIDDTGNTVVVGSISGASLSISGASTTNSLNVTSNATVGGTSTAATLNSTKSITHAQSQVGGVGTTQGGTTSSANDDIDVIVANSTNTAIKLSGAVGQHQLFLNNSGQGINIFPISGAQIESLGNNNPFSMAFGDRAEIVCTSTTQCRVMHRYNASALTLGVAQGLSANGTTQATALALTKDLNEFTTVASGAGTIIQANIGQRQEVANYGANALLVYPPSGATIEANAANAAVSMPVGGHAVFVCVTATRCRQWP